MLSEEDLTNITPPRVPFLDPRTGNISREWYLFLFSQFRRSKDLTSQSNANQVAISSTDLSLQATQQALASTQGAVDDLAVEVNGISLGPVYTPQLERLRYGSFYDTTDQAATVINTAYAMTFNSTDISQGVYIGSPTSRIYVDTHNVYNIQFSAQLINAAGGAHNAWIWLRKNGTDVTNSATVLRVQGNNTELVAAWNFLLSMNAGDYFELMWEVSDLSVSLFADPATAVHPAIPSVILTVTDNISS
jgi:hypothetical protein